MVKPSHTKNEFEGLCSSEWNEKQKAHLNVGSSQ